MNAVDDEGNTPLHNMSDDDRFFSAVALVSRGADLRRLNNAGKTPLDEAAPKIKALLKSAMSARVFTA